MRFDDLTREQARAIKKKIRPMLGYLNRLKKRMDRRKFPHNDPLFNEVVNAADALHRLNVSIHYLSCGQSTGSGYPAFGNFTDAKPILSPKPHAGDDH